MAEDSGDRTEPATPRRRQEARADGSVVRSNDLTAAITLLAAIVLLDHLGGKLMATLKAQVEIVLSGTLTANPTRADDLHAYPMLFAQVFLKGLAPVALGITGVALAATVAQVGFVISTRPLEPNLAKLSPLKGLGGLFDARAGVRLAMSMGKVGLIGAVAVMVIARDMPMIIHMGSLDPLPMIAAASSLVYDLGMKLAALLLVLAIIDYSLQRFQHERDLRMSKQEVKEEMKRMEGDPLVKQRRSRVARQLAMQRVSQAVPKADVVVTNPTHYAVALRYDSARMGAPRVVAKGADFMAMRIRQLAAAHGVPMVERKTLAQALYKGVEVGQEVPPEYYTAVAEILAYVYRLSGEEDRLIF